MTHLGQSDNSLKKGGVIDSERSAMLHHSMGELSSPSGEGGFIFFKPPKYSQYTVKDVSHLFNTDAAVTVGIYHIYNQTDHAVSINHANDYPDYPNLIYINNEKTNLYLDMNPGQNIYLINHEHSLLICCEDGTDRQYFELERKQKTTRECILPENTDEDICGYQEKQVYYWDSYRLRD